MFESAPVNHSFALLHCPRLLQLQRMDVRLQQQRLLQDFTMLVGSLHLLCKL